MSLVSKVHSALVGKSHHSPEQPTIQEAPGDTMPPNELEALEAAEEQQREQEQQLSGEGVPGNPGEVQESREVFKQALQELIEENRVLQEETAHLSDDVEDGQGMLPPPPMVEGDPSMQYPGQPPVGIQQLHPGRISVVGSVQGVAAEGPPGGAMAAPPVAGSLNLPTPASLAAAHGGLMPFGGPGIGGSAALPIGHGGGGNLNAMGGSMRVPMPGATGMLPQTTQHGQTPSHPGIMQQQTQPPMSAPNSSHMGGSSTYAQGPQIPGGRASVPNSGISRTASPITAGRQNPASFNSMADKPRAASTFVPGAAGAAGPSGPCRMNTPGTQPVPQQQQPMQQMYRGNPAALSKHPVSQQTRGRRIG